MEDAHNGIKDREECVSLCVTPPHTRIMGQLMRRVHNARLTLVYGFLRMLALMHSRCILWR